MDHPNSTVWVFGNPDNEVILQMDLKDISPETCKLIDHSGFKFRYNATYLKLEIGKEFLVIGGSDKKDGNPVSDI